MAQLITVLPAELNQPQIPRLPNQGSGFAYDFAANTNDYLTQQQGTLGLLWADLIGIITQQYHLAGTFTITHTVNPVRVTLDFTQPDTDYRVFTQQQAPGEGPVVSITKNVAYFAASVATPPAAGVNWVYDWVLLR